MNERLKKIVRSIAVAIMVCGLGGAAYYFYYGRPPVVKVGTAILAPVSEFVYGNGTVEPVQWAKVVPVQRKRLVEMCHCEGSMVKQGQVLGRQDDAEEVAQLNELQAAHQQLQRELDRAERDNHPTAELEQRRSAIEQSSSRITAQKSRIDGLVLRAPMDGMVLRRDGEVGEIVGPTDVLFWVGTGPLQVVADINEEDILHVALGQTALLTNEALANQSMRATVSQITPKGDPTKKSFRVYLRLPSDTPLKIGMNVEANIIFRETPSAIVVPNEAVQNGAVQVVGDDNRIKRITVSTGVRGTRATEVRGNISPGVTILVPARKELADGARVRFEKPVNQASQPSSAALSAKPPAASSDAEISAALSAHIEGIVREARRDAPQSR